MTEENGGFPSAVAGDNLNLGQEPTNVETTPKAEDTAKSNEVKAPETGGEEVTPKVEEGGDSKHSSKLISELGEDRKKVVQKFFESAKKSGIAAEELKELVKDDHRLEKYVKTKFGDDYDSLMEGSFSKKEVSSEDLEKIEKRAYAKAQLDVFKEQDQQLKEKQFKLFAQSNGITSEEEDALREKADLLGTHEEDYSVALKDALLLVNKSKAAAGESKAQFPSGGSDKQPPTASKQVVDDYLKTNTTASPEQIAKSAQNVEEGIVTDDRGNTSYELQI